MKPHIENIFALETSQEQKHLFVKGYPNRFQNSREADVQTNKQTHRHTNSRHIRIYISRDYLYYFIQFSI